MTLDTFMMDVYNTFDYMADKAIQQLINENSDSWKAYNECQAKENSNFNDTNEEPLHYLIRTQESSRYMTDIMYRTEEMIAFLEMKVVYSYKHFEIGIKRLISLAYPEIDMSGFFRWKELNRFLISKAINIKDISNYREVNELRIVNNEVKHSGKLGEEIKEISEFKSHDSIQFDPLDRFYRRVKMAPHQFLGSLNAAFVNQLYPNVPNSCFGNEKNH